MPPYRWKNRIVSKKVYNNMLQRVENGKARKKSSSVVNMNVNNYRKLCNNFASNSSQKVPLVNNSDNLISSELCEDFASNSSQKVPLADNSDNLISSELCENFASNSSQEVPFTNNSDDLSGELCDNFASNSSQVPFSNNSDDLSGELCENFASNSEQKVPSTFSKEEPTEVIKGSRIIDLPHLFKQLQCLHCNNPLLFQDAHKETIRGLGSVFYIECRQCSKIRKVHSGEQYLNPSTDRPIFSANTKVALACIHSGSGPTQLNKILSSLDLPTVTAQLIKQHERIIGPVVEIVAKESCCAATAAERLMTLDKVEELKKLLPPGVREDFLVPRDDLNCSIHEMIVRLFASYDMGWSKRGNGHTYDSLNGYCALIGMLTGQVLDFCTKNRKCKVCDVAAKEKKDAELHDCRLNHYGSAKSMEASGAVQLVTESQILKNAHVEIGVLISDNDSSCASAIRDKGVVEFIRQSDMNHTSKGVGKMLHTLHNNKSQDPEGELSNQVIKHIQRCFTYAVKQNVCNLEKIQLAIENIPVHLKDIHNNCGDWCLSKKSEENKENYEGNFRIENETLFIALKDLFGQLAKNADKFVSAASSQANESLNRSMVSKAPKTNCYSLSESCDYRFAATVAQKNLGEEYRALCYDKLGISVGEQMVKHSENSKKNLLKRREYIKEPKNKKRRLEVEAKRNQLKYCNQRIEGPNMYRSDMSLLDNCNQLSSCPQASLDNNETTTTLENENFCAVFFDLETGGFDLKCDILQIALKYGEKKLNCYIQPKYPISPAASKINKFSTMHKKLYQNGREVNAVSTKEAFLEVLDFLKLANKKCLLVAHNCSFDRRHFVNKLKKLCLVNEFSHVLGGFVDTLSLFKKAIPGRAKNGYNLTALAELLTLSTTNAHDAMVDVIILERLAIKFLNMDDFVSNIVKIQDVEIELDKTKLKKQLLPAYSPMISVIKSGNIIAKVAAFGISYELLVETLKNKGIEETEKLLRCERDGKVNGVKTKKIMDKIINYLLNNNN